MLLHDPEISGLGAEIRTKFNALMFFRQRSRFDLEAILEENSAIIPREQRDQLYLKANSRDHGFLYFDLMQSAPAKMFYASFNARLVPRDASLEEEDE